MYIKDFCQAVSNENKPSKDVLVNMIKQCSVEHSKLVKEAAMGNILLKINYRISGVWTR